MEQKLIKDFEFIINSAELKALSKLSLEQPLTDKQYNKLMALAQKIEIK